MNVNAARRGEVRFFSGGGLEIFFDDGRRFFFCERGGLRTGLDEKAGERSVEELGVVCDLMVEALRTIGG